ncbi:adenylate kinase family protein [Blattabacterium cuenoti]|uniref:adenylate kinase family protein n=1 Tax=Blattabacterium cuenoti TaxID=1653831 RepID=UPI00163BE58F|nr:nucleoside monophosphate kinase [Blattabacterium cuenoti]
MIHIILFGPPGCGKGTQARILSKKFGWYHLSTGKIFRKHIKFKTDFGKKIFSFLKEGKLVPDYITKNLVKIEIEKNVFSDGIIYDGYPRTKNQIFFLEEILKNLYLGNINIIFSFFIREKLLIDRLIKRGKISDRDDDNNILTIYKRIEEYKNNTEYIWNNEKWKKYIVNIQASLSINNISFFIEKNILKRIKYF